MVTAILRCVLHNIWPKTDLEKDVRRFIPMSSYHSFCFLALVLVTLEFLTGITTIFKILHHSFYIIVFDLECTSYVGNKSPMLIYSTAKEIRLFSASRPKQKPSIILQNYTSIASIDYHYEKKKIFWVDQHSQSIFSIDYKNNIVENKVNNKN